MPREKGVLPFRQWGGARPGAGRKPKGERAGVRHGPRGALAARYPVHVTVRVCRGLPRLRRVREYGVLRAAFAAGCERGGFRLVHYCVLNDHLHFVMEGAGREAVARGVQGLLIRVAKALNRLWGRKGRVFADRYFDRVLRTPREVRNAVRYVLGNGFKHHRQGAGEKVPTLVDTFSSAPWFDGWKETVRVLGMEPGARPVAGPRTWLLGTGWRRLGLLSVAEAAG